MARKRVAHQSQRHSRYHDKQRLQGIGTLPDAEEFANEDGMFESRRGHRHSAREPRSARHVQRVAPATENQRRYIQHLEAGEQVFAIGPEGTGKTYVAACFAGWLYAEHQIDKIILTKPNVGAGPSLGYFKGTLDEKVAPWAIPLIEALKETLGGNRVDLALKRGEIEIAPFETMRGRTFKDAFVILDEAQNTTEAQMRLFLTRLGENARVAICGDTNQQDLPEHIPSGLAAALDLIRHHGVTAAIVEFTLDDITRSGRCAEWAKGFVRRANQRALPPMLSDVRPPAHAVYPPGQPA